MSRIAELREFVETHGRGATLDLPHDTARELLAEIDHATSSEIIRQALNDAALLQDGRGLHTDALATTGCRATVSTRHP